MPKCADCGTSRRRLHKHHDVPKSLGGSNHPSNRVRLCANCHEDRHDTEEGRKPWANGQTPEARAKRQASMAALWDTPEFRAAQAAGVAASWDDPETRERRVEGIKAHWTDEERAEHGRKISATKRAQGDQGNVDNLAKGWDPEVRARATQASADKRRGTKDSDEVRAKKAASAREAWARRKAAASST